MKPETITKQIFKNNTGTFAGGGAVCISFAGRCVDVLDMVSACAGTWGSGNAADRQIVPKISGQRMDVFKSNGNCRKWFPYMVSRCGQNY